MEDKKVIYKNQLIKELKFNILDSYALNILNAVFYLAHKQEQTTISLKDFKKLTADNRNIKAEDFNNYLENEILKKLGTYITIKTEEEISTIPIFNKLTYFYKTDNFYIELSDYFKKYFKGWLTDYTSYPLIELVNLKSKYSKILYMTLKSWRKKGVFVEDYNKFIYETLGIPKDAIRRNITTKYIKPIVNELSKLNCFENLTIDYIKNNKIITTIVFKWKAEEDKEFTPNKAFINKLSYKINSPLVKESKQAEKELLEYEETKDFLEKTEPKENKNELPF